MDAENADEFNASPSASSAFVCGSPPLRRHGTGLSLLILLGLTSVCLAGWFDWGARGIVVVRGTTSIKNEGERVLAGKVAARTDKWLTELGLRHKLLNDTDVTPWTLRGARAVILPYNPNLTRTELKTYQSVIQSGGILLVFYGMNTNLAAMMSVKPGSHRTAATQGQWSRLEFDTAALPGLPEAVYQSSSHLIPVYPASGSARILARWTDLRGNPAPEPGWVRSPAGFWMSHILQPGDEDSKKQVLLAMLATVIPGAWDKATEKLLAPQRPFGNYGSLKAARNDLGGSLPGRLPEGANPGVTRYLAARASLADLTRRYARHHAAELAGTNLTCGIWLDPDTLNGPDTWPSLASNGINTVFFHVGNPLMTVPNPAVISGTQPRPERLHAWLTCLNVETAPATELARLREAGRLQVSDSGKPLNWLCPSHPENRRLLTTTASRLAQEGVFAGIQLDYIRYPNRQACFCPGCRGQFEKKLGHAVSQWPDVARNGSVAVAYRQWRAEQITACVTAIRFSVKKVDPSIKVSAAVYGDTPACYATVGQDWPGWLDRDLLDFACPMNYTSDLAEFSSLIKKQAALPAAHRILPGIGVSTLRSHLTADQTLAQIIEARQAGFPGFVLFEFSPTIERDVLEFLPYGNKPPNERKRR